MSVNGKLLGHLQEGVSNLLEAGHFENGREFRPTQRESLLAYKIFLEKPDFPDKEKLTGYFEIPTGIGKTALFAGLSGVAHALASAESKGLRTVIVVPTTHLLTQTKDDLENFSPSLKGDIGLYGGEKDNRDLSKPVTIITYASWLKMMETGELHSGNVDLLISDEAHRGTSVRQLTNLFNSFDTRTARIAFTATAHFDKEKSVQKTHHNEIFYKPIADGVKGGELAAYIQTQMHIIRAMPSKKLTAKFEDASNDDDKDDARYRRMVRQAAWNKAAVAFYRDCVDEHTDDPVSDNQAGFFTAGIRQADHLEKMLNADPALAQKAAENGYKAVAVVIHSQLPPGEQTRRMEAYKKGEYMAVIGDEKFKEGFDHPPMKTIIDYPHSSLVDKAQIIGRGARQWLNPAKDGRAEGLTFIDTIVYNGSDDPKEDKRLRDSALRNAVTAWDILQGTVVLGPGQEKVEGGKGKKKPPVPFEDVESYSDLHEVNLLLSEREKLRRDNWVEITDEMRAKYIAQKKRTGGGSIKLLDTPNSPDDLTVGMIDSIAEKSTDGSWRIKNFCLDHWNWIMSCLESMPDAPRKITITEKMRSTYIAKKALAGVSPREILDCCDRPEGLTVALINTLTRKLSDGSWDIKNIRTDHWVWIMARLKFLRGERREITKEMRDAYISERKRTGASAKDILDSSNRPKGITVGIIDSIQSKNNNGTWRIDSIRSKYWDWIMASMKDMPDAPRKTEMTEKMRNDYVAKKNLISTTPQEILNCSDRPDGLTKNLIYSLTQKRPDGEWNTKNIRIDHWNWIMTRLNSMLDKNLKPSDPDEEIVNYGGNNPEP